MTDTKSAHKILRVLILDDSPDDAEQASAALRHAGFMLKSQRLETGVAVEHNLDSSAWDLVLCAHGLNGLPVRQVVELVARKQPFVPVIALARRIADDELRTLMQAGVRDVIIKGQWGRLVPVTERELEVAAERRTLHDTREAMRSLEARYRTMIEASLESIAYVQDGMHMDANPSYLRLFGYDSLDTLKETPLLNLIDKADQARFKQALKKPEGADKPQECQAVTAAGNRISLEVAITPLTINGEPCVQVVATDISKRKALESKLQTMHQRDPLTGLYNRGHFLTAIDDALKVPGGAVLGITVHGLADLNQSFGHTACDRMLVQLARHLREVVGNHPAARVAGGQFAVLFDPKGAAAADALAGKLREMLAGLHIGEGPQATVPQFELISCRFDGHLKDRQAVLDAAFATETRAPAPAPVAAPAARPAPAVTPSPAATAPAPEEAPRPPAAPALREALAHALAGNKMELLFQPIINLHGEPRSFYQAQLALPVADGRLVPAREYLPAAEAAGLSTKIDRTMLLNVIDTLSRYQLEGRAAIVFVGLSPAAVHDNALLAAIQMHMKATGLNSANLILEVDEAALAKDMDACKAFFDKARSIGVGVGVQHFSNQTVSIEALTGLPVDFFAVDCGAGGLDEEMLYGAIDAVHALDRQIIVRGLDEADLFSTLFSRGVHYVQGDYLQPATTGLDYSFEADQTLTSDETPGPSWRVAG